MRDELKKKIDKIIEGHLIHGVIALGCADQILALIEGERDLKQQAHLLAMFVLQSPYYRDNDIKECVDNVLALTMDKKIEVKG